MYTFYHTWIRSWSRVNRDLIEIITYPVAKFNFRHVHKLFSPLAKTLSVVMVKNVLGYSLHPVILLC